MSNWISVDDGLPKISHPFVDYGEWVITITQEKQMFIGTPCWIDEDSDLWVWKNELGGDIEVTHWMSLPEPPGAHKSDNSELSAQLTAAQERVKELEAYVERLRKAYYENRWIDDRDFAVLNALDETPTQSINHIRAEVEEETIDRCVRFIYDEHDSMDGIADSLDERIPRKYSAAHEQEEGE